MCNVTYQASLNLKIWSNTRFLLRILAMNILLSEQESVHSSVATIH